VKIRGKREVWSIKDAWGGKRVRRALYKRLFRPAHHTQMANRGPSNRKARTKDREKVGGEGEGLEGEGGLICLTAKKQKKLSRKGMRLEKKTIRAEKGKNPPAQGGNVNPSGRQSLPKIQRGKGSKHEKN